MSRKLHWSDVLFNEPPPLTQPRESPLVLAVLDRVDAQLQLESVLRARGYYVIGTDNGQEAARHARQTKPDLVLVDLDVPLLYGLIAARQIVKHAQLGPLPVVIVNHDDTIDPAPMIEVGVTRDEYVTRLSDYVELHHLLEYLLPVLPAEGARRDSIMCRPLLMNAPGLRPHPAAVPAASLARRNPLQLFRRIPIH